MTDSEHTLTYLSDYVLGLLPADDRRRVEQHTRSCDDCEAALRRERQLVSLVRGTLSAVAPAPGRLEALRPAIAPRLPSRMLFLRLAPASLAAFALCVALLLASGSPLGPAMFGSDGTPALTSSPTSTSTRTPTATLAAAPDSQAGQPVKRSTLPSGPAPAAPAGAPPAAATPIVSAAP